MVVEVLVALALFRRSFLPTHSDWSPSCVLASMVLDEMPAPNPFTSVVVGCLGPAFLLLEKAPLYVYDPPSLSKKERGNNLGGVS